MMHYNLKYTNENGQSIKFESTAQRFVDTVESTNKDFSEIILINFEGFGEVGAKVHSSKSPHQDGSTMSNLTLEERYPYLEFMIRASDYGLLSNERRKISRVFNPKSKGTFHLSYEGLKYTLDVIPENIPSFSSEDSAGQTQIVSVNFIAHDPYWESASENKAEIARWLPMFEFPLSIPDEGIKMGERQESLIVNVNNRGDVSTGMKIVFRADATVVNPSLFNVNTREYFKIEKTLVAGDQVVVTTGFQNKKVRFIQNGVTSTLHEFDYNSTYMQLELGDNLFRYDADEGLDSLSVDVYYTQRYIGV